jgi:hypothetical protein
MKKLIAAFLVLLLPVQALAECLIEVNEATSGRRNVMFFMEDETTTNGDASISWLDADIQISKAGAAFANGAAASVTDRSNGWYSYALSTGNVDTVGQLVLSITKSGSKPMRRVCLVYDLIQNRALPASPTAGSLWARLKSLTDASGTAQAGGATTITLASGASSVDDFYNNNITVMAVGGTGAGQARCITDYVGSTRVATVSTWVTNPDATTQYVLVATPNCNTTGSVSIAAGGITSSSFAAGAIDAAAIAAAAITNSEFTATPTVGALGATAKSDVNAEVVDALNVDTYAESGALPGTTPTILQMLRYVYENARNKLETTATTITQYANDGTTVRGTSTLSDNGTTFTRGRMN